MFFSVLRAELGILLNKPIFFVAALLCITILAPTTSESGTITLYQSVEQALKYSPQLHALTHSHQAAQFDLKQSRARYLPSVDLLLGYGLEQHSDHVTRQAGADPADTNWDSRGDATLRLTQKVYDGGETSQQVAIQKALLDSAHFQIQSAAQAVALNAVTAHLNVFRQRELVILAEKNLIVHQDIYQSLAEREQAGAGSIADVTQAQARMARAQSTLYLSKADLSKALANYSRVIGFSPEPENVTYAGIPETLPPTLEKALELMRKENPELLILTADLAETDARVALTRSTYKPKIDIQLSSRYHDQLEGDQSWQNTNEAMLNLRWNLFNGGQDKAGENAALSRKYQSRSARDDKLFELQEATSAAWATYKSLQGQKVAYRDAVDYSQKTFEAYLNQFSVSQRSLLDVLSAEQDYFHSASQLITVTVNETLTAYRILALTGDLQVPTCSGSQEYPEDLKRLSQALELPSAPPSEQSFGASIPE
ncbi:MAG: TolC family outer membrane protein [Deltaproteobacteria bacterium]|jgi:adhesin transport system outer membrane protein|nr:TolC family outer membrane protein [Deltaproteobacteria bacterium]